MKITFKGIRITIFSLIFIVVLNYTYRERVESREWNSPLEMIIYPINATGSKSVDNYIAALSSQKFSDIDEFIERQGQVYNIEAIPPITTELGPTMHEIPPERPRNASILSNMWWSLKLRYWAYKHTPESDTLYTLVRMYVLYYDLKYNYALPHSSGLQKGLLGVVHAFAVNSQNSQNDVVIAHEFLHTVGASDKYDPRTNGPLVPEGLANPQQKPLFPQRKAEIMGGRIALTAKDFRMPDSLRQCVIGKMTAQEIGWYKKSRA